ncbi:MAG: FecR domain-containing protein [Elusimicrobia bacterium]|nr:FecR domain-containing protein [Elusimicrobiota bacterium]
MSRIVSVPLLAALCVLPAEAGKKPAAPAKTEVRVLSVSGGVLTSGGKPAAAGTVVADGAELRLDAGHAVLDFGGEGKVQLDGPAVLAVGGRRLTLSGGGLLSVLPRLKGRYAVATPVAVAAVRGTEFYIAVRKDGGTYLCLCEGAVEVTGGKGVKYSQRFEAKHHLPAVFAHEGKTLKRSEAPMLEHQDADIEALR